MGQDNVRQGEDIANSSSMNAWRVPKTEVVGDGPKIVGRTKGERGVGKTGRKSAERVKLKIQKAIENKMYWERKKRCRRRYSQTWPARIGLGKRKKQPQQQRERVFGSEPVLSYT
jgi:hypothetical protein